MRTDITDRAGYYDWDGICDPAIIGDKKYPFSIKTFSVGIFKWLPKANGKGLKHGKVICRISGCENDPSPVYNLATVICRECDRGELPTRKTYRIGGT